MGGLSFNAVRGFGPGPIDGRLRPRTYGHAVSKLVSSLVRHHHASFFAEIGSENAQLSRQVIGEAGGYLTIGEYQAVVIGYGANANNIKIEPRHVQSSFSCKLNTLRPGVRFPSSNIHR